MQCAAVLFCLACGGDNILAEFSDSKAEAKLLGQFNQ
jgi:hypothetical protein